MFQRKKTRKNVLLLHQDDARALCFAWWLSEDRWKDFSPLRRAAEMGNAFACSVFSGQVLGKNNEQAFRLAQLAATKHERDGFYLLGCCFLHGYYGCEKDITLAKENFLIAAELGDVLAADAYGRLLGELDPTRWLWLGRAALRGFPSSFLQLFSEQVEQFFSGSGNAAIVFLIGRALKGKLDMEKKEIFGNGYCFDDFNGHANQAVSFYDSQIKSTRLAIDTWTLVSTRLHLIKDLRIYIGKIVWELRFEANYGFD